MRKRLPQTRKDKRCDALAPSVFASLLSSRREKAGRDRVVSGQKCKPVFGPVFGSVSRRSIVSRNPGQSARAHRAPRGWVSRGLVPYSLHRRSVSVPTPQRPAWGTRAESSIRLCTVASARGCDVFRARRGTENLTRNQCRDRASKSARSRYTEKAFTRYEQSAAREVIHYG